jgi:hypothetical protein
MKILKFLGQNTPKKLIISVQWTPKNSKYLQKHEKFKFLGSQKSLGLPEKFQKPGPKKPVQVSISGRKYWLFYSPCSEGAGNLSVFFDISHVVFCNIALSFLFCLFPPFFFFSCLLFNYFEENSSSTRHHRIPFPLNH